MSRNFRGTGDSSPKTILMKGQNRPAKAQGPFAPSRKSNKIIPRDHVDHGLLAQKPRCAASACCARFVMYAKNAGDWPMKSPMFVRNVRAPMATPSVLVGRMIEQRGNLRLRNGHGSGIMRFFCQSSPPSERSGNVTDTPVTGSTAVNGGALPALSAQV